MARATIGDVARLAGVSTATVSRVLTGSVPVSPRLRDQVYAAAQQLDYSVNVAARALKRARTSTVGMVVPDLSNPFFTVLIDRVENGLQQLGLSLHVCSSSIDAATEAERIRSLRQSQVDVLLVTPVHVTLSAASLKDVAQTIPVVQLDQFAEGVDSDWVGTDEALGMRLVFEHLAAQGVRTAAYVGAELADSSALVRYDAAHAQARALGIDLAVDPALLGGFSVAWGVEAARLLARGPLPDAVVCAADVIALGVLEEFDARGVSVPGDVLLTGFDDIPLSSHPRLALTTVRQSVDEIARATVQIVRELRDGVDPRVHRREAIRPELVVRTSSRRP